MVPPVLKLIVSLPGVVLALSIACRSDPVPLSLRLVTVKVAAPAGMLKITNKINNINAIGGVTDGLTWGFLRRKG